ncbi:hypothetical protein OG21DRAFT_1423685 [Imleria badia]|nr:hypothetical protein OG21DRAFT_1423685 [Imleria badia]
MIPDTTKQDELLTQAHDSLGHHEEKATWESLHHQFYWPHMYRQHVKSYYECQIRNIAKICLSITTPPPSAVFTIVNIDIMLIPQVKGHYYIVLGRDKLSKYIEGRAL